MDSRRDGEDPGVPRQAEGLCDMLTRNMLAQAGWAGQRWATRGVMTERDWVGLSATVLEEGVKALVPGAGPFRGLARRAKSLAVPAPADVAGELVVAYVPGGRPNYVLSCLGLDVV